MKVGFIGLGNMGAGMSRNLIKAGHDLIVYNRTRSHVQEMRSLQAKSCRLRLVRVLEEDAHADATRDGTEQADRSEGLSGCPADGRILPDVPMRAGSLSSRSRCFYTWAAKHDAAVVEAQEEAEEAHGFERQNRKREIDVCVFVSILLATSTVTMAATIVATGMPRVVDSLGGSAYYSCIFFAYWLAQCTMTVNSPSAHRHKPLRIPSPFDLDV